MRTAINKLLSLSCLSLVLLTGMGTKARAQDVTVSYQTFYDNLSPYGQWIYDPQYGNVWVPNEDGDFRPYGSRGHWVMTDYGNTWVSDDPWGWACYHYGRWTYNPYYGWVWIPGYEWAPAWVSWRYGGGYCGWAPLGPGISVGIGYNCPDSWWVFVGPQYMYRPDCFHYWRGPSYNTTYIHQTTIINNYYVDNGTHVRYNYGPRADVIQRDTHQPVQVYRVSQLNRPGAPAVGRNTVSLYRPSVNRGTISQARPQQVMQAPRSVGQPQAAVNTGNRQPAFRQEVQRQAPGRNTGVVGPQQQPGRTQPGQSQPGRIQPGAPQQPGRTLPNQTQQPGRVPPNQPQQPGYRGGEQRPMPAPQQRNDQPRPQAPQPRIDQQRQQPAPQPRMEQPRPQPAPQPRMEQTRPQPRMENHPAPQQYEGGRR